MVSQYQFMLMGIAETSHRRCVQHVLLELSVAGLGVQQRDCECRQADSSSCLLQVNKCRIPLTDNSIIEQVGTPLHSAATVPNQHACVEDGSLFFGMGGSRLLQVVVCSN